MGIQASTTCAAESSLESRIQAALVLNFIPFIGWPDGAFAKADDPIVIGIVSSDSMESALVTAIDGKIIKGRKLIVVHISPGQPISGCHVLIIGPEDQAQTEALIKSVGSQSIVTIGDFEGFTDAGGTIRFYTEDEKERFEINLASANRQNLQISAKLLKLARIVNK